jgi:hypothetical protein
MFATPLPKCVAFLTNAYDHIFLNEQQSWHPSSGTKFFPFFFLAIILTTLIVAKGS